MLTWTMTINATDHATPTDCAQGRRKLASAERHCRRVRERPARVLVVIAVALVAACGGEDLDPGDALTAALAASGAYDALDDLGALDDPDAAGSRDAFRAATVEALERAREAHRTAPRATEAAYRASLNAGELADRFGLALGAALKARSELDATETAVAAGIAQAIAELEDRIGFPLPAHERVKEAAVMRRLVEKRRDRDRASRACRGHHPEDRNGRRPETAGHARLPNRRRGVACNGGELGRPVKAGLTNDGAQRSNRELSMVRDRNGDGLPATALLHHEVTALPPHLPEPVVSRVRRTPAPEGRRSLANRDVQVRDIDLASVLPLLLFRRRSLEEQLQRFPQVLSRFTYRGSLADYVELRAEGDVEVIFSFDDCRSTSCS